VGYEVNRKGYPEIVIRNRGLNTEILIDGKAVDGVRGLKFEHHVNNLPCLEVKIASDGDYVKNSPQLLDSWHTIKL